MVILTYVTLYKDNFLMKKLRAKSSQGKPGVNWKTEMASILSWVIIHLSQQHAFLHHIFIFTALIDIDQTIHQ